MYRISTKLSLPEDAARWTFADLAIKGAGKTYAACVMAEEFVKNGVPIIAIDPLGIWWGLRVGIDGHEGLPVVVFGGKHQDRPIPTNIEKGHEIVDEAKLKLMVKAILESRMNAVLDTKLFSKSMSRRIVAIFVSELNLLNENYGVRHVFLEEADEWVPQHQKMKDAWASQAFGAVDNLVRQGGNFLLGCTLITQRSAVISKDVLTQINCLIALRTLHKRDKAAVREWVESVANPEDKRTLKFVDSLKDLENGEAWVWHPEEPKLFERIKFRQRETLHATREYFTRSEFEQKDIAMMPVGEFVAKYDKLIAPVKSTPPISHSQQVRTAEKPVSSPVIEYKPAQAQSQPSPISPGHLGSLTEKREVETTVKASHEPVNSGPRGVGESVVYQALPGLEIRQFKPVLSMSVESMNEPTTALGRVCVVLKNSVGVAKRQDQWSRKAIKKRLEGHSWPEEGSDAAIDQLIRWEILTLNTNGMMTFKHERITVRSMSESIPA